MYERQESEYFTAKRKAARQMGVDHRFRPKDLPSNAEIREQIQQLAQIYEGDARRDNLKAMRLTALRLMRLLDQLAEQLRPNGSVEQPPRMEGRTMTMFLAPLKSKASQADREREREREREKEGTNTSGHAAEEDENS